jgi:DNA-binding YbaB/EbfC family protein
MFDPLKLMSMLKKASDLKKNIELQLKKIKTVSSSGEGMVKIQMNGLFEVEKLNIDNDVFNQKDVNFLEDLIKSCTNNCTYEIKNILIDKIKNIADNINFLK